MNGTDVNGTMPSRRRRAGGTGIWGAIVAAAGSIALSLPASGAGTGRNLTVEQHAVYNVQAPVTAVATQGERLSVTAWLDRANGTYALGEQVRLFVRANKDSYLTVLNVGASGKTTMLFPNAHQPQMRVGANQVVEIPPPGSGASIRVSGPTGQELIKVIASTQPTSFVPGGTPAGPFMMLWSDSRTLARDLQVTMDGGGGAQEWADYNQVITTIGAQSAVGVPGVGVPGAGAVVPLVPAPAGAGTAWPQAGYGLRVSTDKPVYRMGETVSVYASTAVPCYLTLVNIGSSGQVRMLLPNAQQPQSLISAGQTMVFPVAGTNLRLTPMGPPGMETVVAVCSGDQRLAIPPELLYGQGGHAAMPGTATRDLAVVGAGSSAAPAAGKTTVSFAVTL